MPTTKFREDKYAFLFAGTSSGILIDRYRIDLENFYQTLVDYYNYPIENIKNKGALWLCKCTCGRTTIASGGELRSGGRKSCGCLQKENCLNMANSPQLNLYR